MDGRMDGFPREKINMVMNLKELCVCMCNIVCRYLHHSLTQQQLRCKLSLDQAVNFKLLAANSTSCSASSAIRSSLMPLSILKAPMEILTTTPAGSAS